MQISQVAAQLYTVRDFCKTAEDLAQTARKIRKIGYEAVQVSGLGPIPLEEVKTIMNDEGLVICATHEKSDLIRTEPLLVVENLKTLGAKVTAYPYPSGVDFSSLDDIKKLAADLERTGAILREYECELAYHNHAIEFVRLEGKTVLEHLLDLTKPAHLGFELDTYWVQYGGACPVRWSEKVSGRFPAIHLKDYQFTPENKPAFAEIGSGNLDFPAIVKSAENSGCQWFIVEQDVCPGDPFDSLKMSFDYIKRNLCK